MFLARSATGLQIEEASSFRIAIRLISELHRVFAELTDLLSWDLASRAFVCIKKQLLRVMAQNS
jgi:hypothetical protein